MQAATMAVAPISTWAPASIQRAVVLVVMVIACCMLLSCSGVPEVPACRGASMENGRPLSYPS